MIVCIPLTPEGGVDPRWGRAERLAVATVSDAGIDRWQEFDVGWGRLHDGGSEGEHHARVAQFLREHEVEAVVAGHMGSPMEHILGKMRIKVYLGASGPAKDATLGAISRPRQPGGPNAVRWGPAEQPVNRAKPYQTGLCAQIRLRGTSTAFPFRRSSLFRCCSS